jgi:hypothetical protein
MRNRHRGRVWHERGLRIEHDDVDAPDRLPSSMGTGAPNDARRCSRAAVNHATAIRSPAASACGPFSRSAVQPFPARRTTATSVWSAAAMPPL